MFGGGCFWCTEAVFLMLRGVQSVEPGYAGGTVMNPNYDQVSAGTTGHAEVIRITYDPAQVRFEDLLTVFFATHDPTTLNRQGNDVGTQYRSVILYADAVQKSAAEAYIADLETSAPGGARIVTEIAPLDRFWPAEDYHREYYSKNREQPYCQAVIAPKVAKAKAKFAALLRENGAGAE